MTLRSETRFDLARPADEAALRRLLWETPMVGEIDLVFTREPDYFAAHSAQGPFVQTLVARRAGKVVGLATRAIRPARINGVPQATGYLADLRFLPEARRGTLLARGYRFLRELHEDGRARIYSTLIVEDNQAALTTIAANRANLPRYSNLGRLLTPLLLVGKRHRVVPRLDRGNPEDLPEIIEILNRNSLQFAPVYEQEDFSGRRFPGFELEDFLLIRRDGRIEGVAGVWDQRLFRQVVPLRYRRMRRVLRPALNRLFGFGLPPTGEPFRLAYLSFLQADSVDDFRTLLLASLGEAARKGFTHLVAGLHERDPRSEVFSEFSRIPFAGRMFAVTFEGPADLDGRVPYLEPSTL